jgi:hypothetical protein
VIGLSNNLRSVLTTSAFILLCPKRVSGVVLEVIVVVMLLELVVMYVPFPSGSPLNTVLVLVILLGGDEYDEPLFPDKRNSAILGKAILFVV